ncbi:MAG: hybrid sensor histidine kinase/response regulator [Deltaproteobacteria bacterium]|jgi:two-component system sensor histidine kinase and response regulator WspE|nr:hybrid sensor histidine kinase/response regulator [Deltaproteobacteria bacterium]
MTIDDGGYLGNMSMMDLFRLEAENQCLQLAEDLLALEQNPTASNLLESLMRASHSIKGAARFVELHPVVGLAHTMEDVFVAAQAGKFILDQEGIDLLLEGVDMLNSISLVSDDAIENFYEEHAVELDSLMNRFRNLIKGKKVSRQTAPPLQKEISEVTQTKLPPDSKTTVTKTPELPVDLSDMSMLDLFRLEAEKHCTNLSEGLVTLENRPHSPELLESLMRSSHSMKGAARIVELVAAVKLAHAMEDLFTAAQKEKIIIARNDLNTLHQSVDMLTTIAGIQETESEKWFSDHNAEVDELVNKLNTIIRQKKQLYTGSGPQKPVPEETVRKTQAIKKESSAGESIESEPMFKLEQVQKPARRAEDKDGIRSIRVTAQSMERIMGLASESLIESRWLPTFNKELLRLKYRQDELHKSIDKTLANLQTVKADALTLSLFNDLQGKLEMCRSMLKQDMEVLEDHARHAINISHRLYKEIITSKMRPFSEGTRRFARMVRDVARKLGKEVTFEVIGADTMVDRDILDKIEAPLNHMIINAIDHGIEPPVERIAMGKTEKGSIRLIARHSAGMLSITVQDDGRGIDLEKLRQTIIEKKLCTPELAADLSEHELLDFLLLPNFSTRKGVSEVSGRGVGMDVVHSVINEVRGNIHCTTNLHKGSSFEMQLPITLSVLRSLLTEINCELYAFPLVAIDHVLQLAPDQIQEVEGRQYFTYNERRIGIVSAQQIFKTETPSDTSHEYFYVIVFSDRINIYGLTVDNILGVRDLVVQRLDPRLGKVKDINSASILEDGTPVFIIDVQDVFRSLHQLISGDRLIPIGKHEDIKRKVKRILVADDSITVREIERKMLLAQGYEVDVAVDGMDAWNTVRANIYDLIITDIDMPRMNGFELVSLIKNNPDLRSLPVIIVSYKDRETDRKQGLKVGADYYLTKGSFHDQSLVNAVLDLIGEAVE